MSLTTFLCERTLVNRFASTILRQCKKRATGQVLKGRPQNQLYSSIHDAVCSRTGRSLQKVAESSCATNHARSERIRVFSFFPNLPIFSVQHHQNLVRILMGYTVFSQCFNKQRGSRPLPGSMTRSDLHKSFFGFDPLPRIPHPISYLPQMRSSITIRNVWLL